MNTRTDKKRIKLVTVSLFFMALGVISYVNSSPASALTKAQKEQCYERWAGRSTGTAGGSDAKKYNEAEFKKTNCYKEDTCKIERYQDGSTIHCFNVATGKFDSQNSKNRPSTDDGGGGGGGETVSGCGDVQTSLIKCDGAGTDSPVVNMLLQIINFMAVGVGIAVVGGIAWGGMLYASSNGDSSKAKQGITTIVNSILGLFLFMFTYAFINFLVPGGLFN